MIQYFVFYVVTLVIILYDQMKLMVNVVLWKNKIKQWKKIKSAFDCSQKNNKHLISIRWVDFRKAQQNNHLSIANQLCTSKQININKNCLHVLFLLNVTL